MVIKKETKPKGFVSFYNERVVFVDIRFIQVIV